MRVDMTLLCIGIGNGVSTVCNSNTAAVIATVAANCYLAVLGDVYISSTNNNANAMLDSRTVTDIFNGKIPISMRNARETFMGTHVYL